MCPLDFARCRSQILTTAAGVDVPAPTGGITVATASLRPTAFTHAETSFSSPGRLLVNEAEGGLSAEDSARVRDDRQAVGPHDVSARGAASRETEAVCEVRRVPEDSELRSRFFSPGDPPPPTQVLGEGRRGAGISLGVRRNYESLSSGGGSLGIEDNASKALPESGERTENHRSSTSVASGTGVSCQLDSTSQLVDIEDRGTTAAAWRCELLDSGDQRDLRMEEVRSSFPRSRSRSCSLSVTSLTRGTTLPCRLSLGQVKHWSAPYRRLALSSIRKGLRRIQWLHTQSCPSCSRLGPGCLRDSFG